jgi:hypothetical protein
MGRSLAVTTFAAALLLFAGCGSSTTTSASGRVTYEMKPVENGAISFLPADGHGPTAGAQIVDGQYEIRSLMPGKKIVQIVAEKKSNGPVSHDERARQASDNAKRGGTSPSAEQAAEIPADAEGNNRQIEVKSGSQTLDFDLKPKARP